MRHIAAVLVLVAVGCSGDDTTDPPPTCLPGNLRCPCSGNGTCNAGLDCRSNVCVSLAGDPGQQGDSVSGDPSGGDPVSGDPRADGVGDSHVGDPSSNDGGDARSGGDDTGGDPGSGDSGSGDPGSGDTSSGDPGSGDPGSGDAGSGDAGSGDPGNGGDAGGGDVIQRPSNDTCLGADPLIEGMVEGPFSTAGAVDDYDLSCLLADGADTVHAITLASRAALLVTMTPQTSNAALGMALRDDCVAGPDLSCVSNRFDSRYLNAPDVTASTYEVLIDSNSGVAGDYTIRYDTVAADTSFGYWALESTAAFVPLTDATVIPIATGYPAGDSWSQTVELPFDFDFFGTVYAETTAVVLTDDMYLSFNPYVAGSQTYLNDCLDATEPHNMIAPFWDDGIAYAGSAQLLYAVEGTAPDRTLTIEWRNFDIVGPSPNYIIVSVEVSHQVVLFENGDIEFRYGPRQVAVPGDVGCGDQDRGCSATIGIESGTGGAHDADLIDCEGVNTSEGRVIRFVHPTQ